MAVSPVIRCVKGYAVQYITFHTYYAYTAWHTDVHKHARSCQSNNKYSLDPCKKPLDFSSQQPHSVYCRLWLACTIQHDFCSFHLQHKHRGLGEIWLHVCIIIVRACWVDWCHSLPKFSLSLSPYTSFSLPDPFTLLNFSVVVIVTHQSASSLWSTVINLCTLTIFLKRRFLKDQHVY